MDSKKGYASAIGAGICAALAAVAAKFFSSQVLKYGMVVLCNVIMWGCYVNSLKALSSLQATVTNFATNFLSSGLAGFLLFKEPLPLQWFAGAALIVAGVFVMSKSSIESKTHTKLFLLLGFRVFTLLCLCLHLSFFSARSDAASNARGLEQLGSDYGQPLGPWLSISCNG
nr:Drug/metabolite transporter [Ipomoea batatas]